ncbi:MAG: hypothetical protein WC563_15465 [Brevundimonas sp.]|jgi:hypothetical protein|uniref:Uncharacterized protein n=1 Tax=Brevundimonas bullata TaxID=13160 RepID=A0A7W7IQS4_9CAUL|nr:MULTISPECIES: hypothetical protein [Brevundimonas]MBB4798779.1 hypothetical protein [Brevundimonas bullata]MBB6383739.1 hypothetical protein [Brevundimonas bullata]MBD3834631.1 hypothetical protein [Brevundimonas sp.]NWE52095.1 hypothetical protein [Brevundimonas sp. P7753]
MPKRRRKARRPAVRRSAERRVHPAVGIGLLLFAVTGAGIGGFLFSFIWLGLYRLPLHLGFPAALVGLGAIYAVIGKRDRHMLIGLGLLFLVLVGGTAALYVSRDEVRLGHIDRSTMSMN